MGRGPGDLHVSVFAHSQDAHPAGLQHAARTVSQLRRDRVVIGRQHHSPGSVEQPHSAMGARCVPPSLAWRVHPEARGPARKRRDDPMRRRHQLLAIDPDEPPETNRMKCGFLIFTQSPSSLVHAYPGDLAFERTDRRISARRDDLPVKRPVVDSDKLAFFHPYFSSVEITTLVAVLEYKRVLHQNLVIDERNPDPARSVYQSRLRTALPRIRRTAVRHDEERTVTNRCHLLVVSQEHRSPRLVLDDESSRRFLRFENGIAQSRASLRERKIGPFPWMCLQPLCNFIRGKIPRIRTL